ncbi:hypothetical protein [Streptomyces mangrovisoli]|uniref:hypothetical protein n=1 Tax=Streptomyces mangrovisoli TaxID=1428628 RepID=UPI0011607E1C|nr:hypothetical protein [Streptomyces mangrovisoli]
MGRPLKRLPAVRWGELSDATGSAVELPALLSKLAWAGESDARDAIDELAGRVCALGFVLAEATASVIPFLMELAEIPESNCRVEILELVSAVHSTRQWADAAAVAAPKHRSSYDEKVSWEENSRAAVEASRGIIESLTLDSDAAVAALACQLLDDLVDPPGRT